MNPSPSLPAISLATLGTGALAAADSGIADFIAKIRSEDDKVRGPAWQGAGPLGAPAVAPLAEAMTATDFEIARSAKRAIERIVRHAGRPAADAERKAVQAELVKLLKAGSVNVRRHALWMLSEIGDDDAVAPMAALLPDAEARDDARCSLERIPGAKATTALKQGMAAAPEDFKFALAHSLRVRGEKVSGYPSQKLLPTKKTSVGTEDGK
ncbi:MAG: HEAT repeat domain-containing protein [Limisphaerales bacterium]